MRDEAQRTSAGKACAHEFLIFYDVIYGVLQQFCRVLAFYLAIIPRARVAYEWKNCFIKKKNNREILLVLTGFALQKQAEENKMVSISRIWYNSSYTMADKPIKCLE